MTRALMVVATLVMVAGCSDPFGNPDGEYASLRADLEAQRVEIEAILDEALGSYEVLGIRVSVSHCGPGSAWSGGTSFVVMPSDGDRHAAVEAISAVLEGRGLVVEHHEPFVLDGIESVHEQTLPVRSVEVPGFVTGLTFYSGTDPQPGVKIKGGGAATGGDALVPGSCRTFATRKDRRLSYGSSRAIVTRTSKCRSGAQSEVIVMPRYLVIWAGDRNLSSVDVELWGVAGPGSCAAWLAVA